MYWKDVIERALATYLETFIGLLVAANTFADGTVDWSVIQTAAVAAIPAVLSVAKSTVAQWRGNPDSASLTKQV